MKASSVWCPKMVEAPSKRCMCHRVCPKTLPDPKQAHLDVGVKRVGPEDGGGALVALHAVLLPRGHVAAVRISQARQHDMHVVAPPARHLQNIGIKLSTSVMLF